MSSHFGIEVFTGKVRDIQTNDLPWEEDEYEVGIGDNTLSYIFSKYLGKNVEVTIKIVEPKNRV